MQHVALILDKPNKNDRLYPKETVEAALTAIKDKIKNEQVFVAAEEPATACVPLNDVVAKVNDVFIDGDRLVVDFDFLKSNALANAVQEELNRGNISLTTSGMGTLYWDADRKAWVVDKDFEFLCFYFTYTPS